MSEDYQIVFKVKGLVTPEKKIMFDDHILIRGIPGSDTSYVFFKVAVQTDEELRPRAHACMHSLTDITQIYGLVGNNYAEVIPSFLAVPISSLNRFGYPHAWSWVKRIVTDEEREKNIPFIKKTMAKYELVKSIFQVKKKAFLRNAIDYYHRSLGDSRLEEKLIDLMISLESLFSKKGEQQELRLRYSLRASFLLSVGQESELPNIFRNVYELYKKRSKVVHGTRVVDLDRSKISILQKYVREAIQRFIHIEMPKKAILELIDDSVYDEEKREQLNQIVLEAIKKW